MLQHIFTSEPIEKTSVIYDYYNSDPEKSQSMKLVQILICI